MDHHGLLMDHHGLLLDHHGLLLVHHGLLLLDHYDVIRYDHLRLHHVGLWLGYQDISSRVH